MLSVFYFAVLAVLGYVAVMLVMIPWLEDKGKPPEGVVRVAAKDAVAIPDAADAPVEAGPTSFRTYVLSADSAAIAWEGFKVSGSCVGGFGKFDGTIKVPEDGLEGAQIKVVVDMSSVYSEYEILTRVLKGEDFFYIDEYPESVFVSTSIVQKGDHFEVTGNLDLRGVVKSITFPATIEVTEDEVRGEAEFIINRKDFDVGYDEWGGVGIKKEVMLNIEVEAPRSGEDTGTQPEPDAAPSP